MILIKVGGGTNTNYKSIAQDIKNLKEKVVFVHGASKTRNQLAKDLGHPTKTIISPKGITSVLTDQTARDILIMAYSLVNKRWVTQFRQHGLNPVGLSGADGDIWLGQRKKHLISQEGNKKKLVKDTWTGRIDHSNTDLIRLLIENNYLPVITQPAISHEGELINTDNDLNVALMSNSLKIDRIITLFEAPGMLKDVNDENSLIKKIDHQELPALMKYAKGTMKKKLLGAQEAINQGVKTIYWGDARVKHPIKSALDGEGTIIT